MKLVRRKKCVVDLLHPFAKAIGDGTGMEVNLVD